MPIADPLFYLAAVPAVLLAGISKGGFGGGLGVLAVPLMALIEGPLTSFWKGKVDPTLPPPKPDPEPKDEAPKDDAPKKDDEPKKEEPKKDDGSDGDGEADAKEDA